MSAVWLGDMKCVPFDGVWLGHMKCVSFDMFGLVT